MQLFRTRIIVNESLGDFLEWFHNYPASIPRLFNHISSLEPLSSENDAPLYLETCLNIMGRTTTHKVRKEGEGSQVAFIVDHPILQNNMVFRFQNIADNQLELEFTIESRRASFLAILLKFIMLPVFLKRERELKENINRYLSGE